MVVRFREPITEEWPNVEGARAATVEISRERISVALCELECAIEHWRDGEKDAGVSADERRYRAERIARLQMEFGGQWANVKAVLGDEGKR